ncbi:MAG: 2-oxo acid dehydrogenase subunit E2, partial [Gemmatimonadota bacterium]|nr:2-oxo acid dehydrogenase subunit E2 [Gemmatimonadota bacterium]
DDVARGEILAEIETDKATMELVARGEGILRKIISGEGAAVPVGEVIAVIAAADEDIDDLIAAAGGGAPAATAEPTDDTEDGAQTTPPPAPAAPASAPSGNGQAANGPGGRVKASPVAKRLAEEHGIDLSALVGSGPGGRVIKRDVEEAARSGVPARAPTGAPATPAPAGVSAGGPEYVDIPLTQIRKTIARRLAESLGPVPHFFLTVDVDMGRVLQARKDVNRILEARGAKASINDFIVKAAAVALTHHPGCNAWWQGDSIRQFNHVHMGIAVAVPDGLITPVVRNAHVKGIAQIGAEIREMAGRAQEKKLKPEEYTGSTFSISNLGMFGIEEFTAVINPPEAGILAVGGVEQRPVVVDGQVAVRSRMRITMSCDHRVIDGATGAQFLQTLKGFLEEPAAILI